MAGTVSTIRTAGSEAVSSAIASAVMTVAGHWRTPGVAGLGAPLRGNGSGSLGGCTASSAGTGPGAAVGRLGWGHIAGRQAAISSSPRAMDSGRLEPDGEGSREGIEEVEGFMVLD